MAMDVYGQQIEPICNYLNHCLVLVEYNAVVYLDRQGDLVDRE